ncbi:hypothetical protein SHELI_v1c03010 [Spiroplasma helicoides]|uniref:TIGR04561 family membrane protein n=1 Tax=Spiroplasma helicoides TaxID=216938 RepID=A0A1B3SK02_9MOLU|nr:TIGR04561 family membrane protein [Spiroplasma helicoides]AOG60256.1 hypothetical protein SHELI_v1c03010 [Spiroplasma helicoides]
MLINWPELKILKNFQLPLWGIIVIFILVGLITLSIYFFILFRKNRKFVFEKEEVSEEEFKRLDKFEEHRNNFEMEIAQVKKIMRNSKK